METLLREAIRHHQQGRLSEAAGLYRAVLDRSPDQPDALHLLGVVAHQMGHHRDAAQSIGRAIEVRPGEPSFHANLAEVWRALGRPEAALECSRAALRLRPDDPEASNHLGLALLQAGRIPEAIDAFRAALSSRPGFAVAHNNLANALRAQGDEAAAIVHFREAVRLAPPLAEAHSNLGQLLAGRRSWPEALEHCREAVRLRPGSAEAHSNLGNILRGMGRLDEARRHYAEAFRLDPRLAMAANNMAQLLQEEGRIDEALAWHRAALALEPESARFRCSLAGALAEAENHDEAAELYEAVLRADPDSIDARNGLGIVRREQGRDQEAKGHLEAALEVDPDHAGSHCNLGILLEQTSDLAGAEHRFRAALRRDPDHVEALGHLATLLRGKLPEAELAALRRLLATPSIRGITRAALQFGLAQALDGRGDYAEAAEHLREANALALSVAGLRGEVYSPGRHAEFVSGMIAACASRFFERVRGAGSPSERLVFVVGMPRSGTTLVEQILSSHSQVFGAGEQRLAVEHFESLPAETGSGDPPLACLSRLGPDLIPTLSRRYLDRVDELEARRPRLVDKMPDNYLYLGLLAALFPKARFIHCRRDLRDVAVSCWMTNFRRIRWANDQDHIASRFAEYRRIDAHWRDVLPAPVLEVAYEDTVADLEGVARRLVAWCGLDWESACLEFHRSARPVRTASVAQVRQPVYTRSVERWKHYKSALGDLFARLDPGIGPSHGLDASPGGSRLRGVKVS